MYRLAAHTHYFPVEWRRRCHTYDSLDEFLRLFQFKAVIFAQELLSTVVTPLILCFALPSSADAIVEFVREYTTFEEGLGDVCSYSRFNLSLYGNDKYTGIRSKNSSSRFQPTAQGKMEKSFLSFQEQHPKWFPPDGDSKHGDMFQDKIQDFALSQSQIQLGLDPSLNTSQNRGTEEEEGHASMSRSSVVRSAMGRSGLGRSVRFEDATDTITIEPCENNNRNGGLRGSNKGERRMGTSQSMDMSGMDASHTNPFLQGITHETAAFLQLAILFLHMYAHKPHPATSYDLFSVRMLFPPLVGSDWNSRTGVYSRMGSNSMLQSNMAGSNMAGSQFYWLEKYMQTQIREDAIQEEED